MIRHGNRIQVQHENGESEILVLMALAMAAFDSAPRGLDLGDNYRPDQKLTGEDVADLDLIHFSTRGVELIMTGEIYGRDCSLRVAPVLGIKSALEVDKDLFEGWVDDLLLRAKDILAELLPLNRRSSFGSVAVQQQL